MSNCCSNCGEGVAMYCTYCLHDLKRKIRMCEGCISEFEHDKKLTNEIIVQLAGFLAGEDALKVFRDKAFWIDKATKEAKGLING